MVCQLTSTAHALFLAVFPLDLFPLRPVQHAALFVKTRFVRSIATARLGYQRGPLRDILAQFLAQTRCVVGIDLRVEHNSRECRAMTLAFHPPEETHSARFHNQRVRSFNVEIEPSYMRHVREHCAILDTPAAFQGGSMAWLGVKLYNEFKDGDDVSPLSMEGLALEIMATGSRAWSRTLYGRQSPWMRRAIELLQARFTESLTIGEIAAAVEVHPVHLAREFRKHHQCTIGDFVRGLRVEFACEQIQKSKRPLCEISAMAGFFDQSHFSRTFKALTGMTPGEFCAACH